MPPFVRKNFLVYLNLSNKYANQIKVEIKIKWFFWHKNSMEDKKGGVEEMIKVIDGNIKFLAAERPLKTPELYKSNDCYGHAHVLKKYANLNENYQIKGVLEHAAMVYDHVWSFDIAVPLPVIYCFSDYRFLFLRQLTNKVLFAIGPSIHYAEALLSNSELEGLKKQLGKTLLVFPPHSSWSIYVDFDVKYIISVIKEFEKEFENILICLGWRDVLRNIDTLFIREGYTCVTAGNVYDMQFLNRLKTLILLSSHTMSFSFGTHIGFCVYLNRPHWICKGIKQKVKIPDQIKDTAVYHGTPLSHNLVEYVLEAFKEPQDTVTSRQMQVTDMLWGVSHIKNPQELRELFSIAEDMYQKKYLPCDRKNFIGLCQIFDYFETNELKKGYVLLDYLKRVGISNKWLNLVKGFLYVKEGNFLKAEKKIKNLLKDKGILGEKARILMDAIEKREKNLELSLKKDIMSLYPKPDIFSMRKINLPWRNI